MSFFKDGVHSATRLAACSSGNNAEDAVDAIRVVGTANAAAANVLTVTNASFGQATTITIPDPVSATAVFDVSSTVGYKQDSVVNVTAGTTQTQAGATAITGGVAVATTANASDGLILPALSAAMIGTRVQIINTSVNAGKVYCPGATSTNTINGTAGATGVTYAASKTLFLIAISATAWVSTLSN